MAAPQFSAILSKPMGKVERPPTMPAGDYAGRIKGKPVYDVSSKKKTPYVEFTIAITQTLNVDPEELANYEEKSGAKITTKVVKPQFYLTDAALIMLKDFLRAAGIDVDDESKDIQACIEEAANSEVGFNIVHEPSQNGEDMRARFGRGFSLEDYEAPDA